jgi:hypothetical protein
LSIALYCTSPPAATFAFQIAEIAAVADAGLEQALVELARQGINVAPAIVTHVAPLGWAHIGLTGDYVWSDEEQPSDRALSAAQAARINARCLVVPFVLI